jgi:hypothetical protein
MFCGNLGLIRRNRHAGDSPLRYALCGLFFAFFIRPSTGFAQAPAISLRPSPNYFNFVTDPGAGSGAGGQVEPSAYADRYLTRASIGGSVSTIGTGGEVATNLPDHIDVRFFGNFTDIDWKETDSGFYVVVNIGMANTGVFGDFYPWKSLRISPGFLYYNTDRLRGDVQAESGATFTINNVNYSSQDSNPVHGIGRLRLGGRGFMATAGWGHYVSRNEKHWTFPFEAGVAFIDTPTATFNLEGNVCNATGHDCQPAATFPGFESNLQQQLATWNSDVKPFHIYPIAEGGVAYTFNYRR